MGIKFFLRDVDGGWVNRHERTFGFRFAIVDFGFPPSGELTGDRG
jgi:hypothetical protein